MCHKSRRSLNHAGRQFRLEYDAIEPKALLACDMQILGNGILRITGDNAPQTISIVDRGNGLVDVQCQEAGNSGVPRSFTGVKGIRGNLKGGNDVLHYVSRVDVNAALPGLEFQLGTVRVVNVEYPH